MRYFLLLLFVFPGSAQQPEPISTQQAFRFLQHATFGPSRADRERVEAIGYHAWINEQLGMDETGLPAYLDEKPLEWSQDYFFQNAVSGRDQLRQRMAFALHKIFVVSGIDIGPADEYLPYYRILTRHAFGNFYDLLKAVSLNAAMGDYLDMADNEKADAASGKYPNENFARELLQLFTVGLVRLNLDGTPQLDAHGNPVPAYTEADVREFTRAFTGFRNAAGDGRYTLPMVPRESAHDTGEKRLLEGVVLPANQTAMQDLEAALRNVFEHPNAGPFLARALIQQFVTSNPSPAYVARVAVSFNDNGAGVRGDLSAVIRDILTDGEALAAPAPGSGHLREPALYVAALFRAIGGVVADHPFLSDEAAQMGQKILHAPSVFSYFSPFYRIPGGPVAPEFQLLNSESALRRVNFAARLIYGEFGKDVQLDMERFVDTAALNPELLLDMVDYDLFGNRMPADLRARIRTAVNAQPNALAKARAAVYLAAASPAFQVIY
jgi:hypothetical protein